MTDSTTLSAYSNEWSSDDQWMTTTLNLDHDTQGQTSSVTDTIQDSSKCADLTHLELVVS